MPTGISLIKDGTPIASIAACHTRDTFYAEVIDAHQIEEAFRFFFIGSNEYANLISGPYSINPHAVFGKYYKDISMVRSNKYIEDVVQSSWDSWIASYRSKYSYSLLTDNHK